MLTNKSMAMNMAMSMVGDSTNNSVEGLKAMIRKVYARTHLRRHSIELLLKRAGKWQPWMAEFLEDHTNKCNVCIRTGDPEPNKKFSVTKLEKNFNTRVEFDIVYWRKKMVLHIVDVSTGYSGISMISSRELANVIRQLDNTWCHRHGDPMEVKGDQEFEKKQILEWAKKRGINFIPVPARRHNKAGVVERKNRVIKDVLEKLDADPEFRVLSFRDRFSAACYTSNIMYGNRVASSFELVRGYTPSVDRTGQKFVTQEYIDAYKTIEARRILGRIIKSRPGPHRKDIVVGESVLVLLPGGSRPRGHWEELRVEEVREDGSVVVGQGRFRKIIAREDVRKFPQNELASAVLRAQHAVPAKETPSKKYMKKTVQSPDESSSSESESSDDDGLINITPDKESVGLSEKSDVADSSSSPAQIGSTGENAGELQELDCTVEQPDSVTLPRSERIQKTGTKTDSDAVVLRRSTRFRKPIPKYSKIGIPIATQADRERAEQVVLKSTYEQFRNVQFYAREAPWIPRSIYATAEKTEIEDNWSKNIEVVDEEQLPKDANLIGSHFVYAVKPKDAGHDKVTYKFKARLDVHSNRDMEKDSLRTDAAVVSHEGFKMTYTVASQNGMVLGKCEISGAYPQSGKPNVKYSSCRLDQ